MISNENKNIIIIIMISLFGSICAMSQTANLRMSEVSVFLGYQNHNFRFLEIEDFRSLAPDSDLLAYDFSDFSSGNWYYGGTESEAFFAYNIGLQFLSDSENEKFRSNPTINIGIIYNRSEMFSSRLSKTEYFRFDSLISPNTGEILYRDSVFRDSYNIRYTNELIGFNANLLYRYKPENRVTLYSGIGIMGAFSINSGTSIDYEPHAYIENSSSANMDAQSDFRNRFSTNKAEYHEGGLNIFGLAYIPLGIEFRLGRTRDFWKKIHYVIEMQPGLATYYIPDFGTMITGVYRGSFGIKVEIQ